MNYRHIALTMSLEGQSPRKFILDMETEGFEPLYSRILASCCSFLGKEDPNRQYKKIIARKKRKKGNASITQEEEPPSFAELFRHKKYPDLIFALIDTTDNEEETTWFCCWVPHCNNRDKNIVEPLEHFVTVVLKVIGCDKALEDIKRSDTFSLAHSGVLEELKEYNLKQTSLEEKKATFELISDPKMRDILIEFNRKNNILLSDFLANRKGEHKTKLERTLNFLSGQGLLEKNLIVICRKSGQWWNMTIPSIARLKELEKSDVTCTSCGGKITEERIENLFKISQKGSRLVSGSYWMVGQIVETLRKLGVREKDIFVDIVYDGEQIDIISLLMSHMLVFELKDREFSLGDAYKFHGKVSRLSEKTRKKIMPIVITTKTVATEARKLLSEVTHPRGEIVWYESKFGNDSRSREYLFIEGLDQVESGLQKLYDEIATRTVTNRMEEVTLRFPSKVLKEMITS